MDIPLYIQNEPNINTTYKHLSKLLNPSFGLIKSISRERQFHDEPKFWYYSSTLNHKFSRNDGHNFHGQASGFSFSDEKTAIVKCLAESVERYCNFVFRKEFIECSGTISDFSDKIIPIEKYARFSHKQLKLDNFSHFKFTDTSIINWTKCISISDNKERLVPSQLIYLSYPHIESEPQLYPSISTGVAGGGSLSAAIMRGIYEIIERDSFTIFYLNKLPAKKINLKTINSPDLRNIINIIQRYGLELVSLDITSDIQIPVVASLILDRSGIGKAISLGLKCSISMTEAVIGSITEAFHTRGWVRKEYARLKTSVAPDDLLKNSNLQTRGLLWFPITALKQLDFWLKDMNNRYTTSKPLKIAPERELHDVFSKLKLLKIDVIYKDILLEELSNLNFYVVKVIIPDLHPLYLNESFRLLGGHRLYEVPKKLGYEAKNESELNNFPHPFL